MIKLGYHNSGYESCEPLLPVNLCCWIPATLPSLSAWEVSCSRARVVCWRPYSLSSTHRYFTWLQRDVTKIFKHGVLCVNRSRYPDWWQMLTLGEYSSEIVNLAEYLTNVNAKYGTQVCNLTSEMTERVTRNGFYFLEWVKTPTTYRSGLVTIVGLSEQLVFTKMQTW